MGNGRGQPVPNLGIRMLRYHPEPIDNENKLKFDIKLNHKDPQTVVGLKKVAALRERQQFQGTTPQPRNSYLVIYSQQAAMSHLYNPLATAQQLYQNTSNSRLPAELQDSIRFYTARLTQAAGILLRLPQDITAQANVLLYRYWVVDDLMQHEYSVHNSPIHAINSTN